MSDYITLTLTRSNLTIVRKALQRYRTRIEEVGLMGWYDSPETTRQEIARIDSILAELEAASNGGQELEARVAELQSLLDAYAQRVTVQDTEIAILRQREEVR